MIIFGPSTDSNNRVYPHIIRKILQKSLNITCKRWKDLKIFVFNQHKWSRDIHFVNEKGIYMIERSDNPLLLEGKVVATCTVGNNWDTHIVCSIIVLEDCNKIF